MVLASSFFRLIGIAGIAGLVHASCTPRIPTFNLTLTPELTGTNDKLHGQIILDKSFATNETLVLLPTSLASVPTANYGADAIVAFDVLGDLPLSSHESDSGPFGMPTRFWSATRRTEGPVTLRFTASPRTVDPKAVAAPHFDIRNSTAGMTGSMWALVPTPDPMSNDQYAISVTWNVSSEQSAAWTWSEGVGPHSYSFVGPLTRLQQTYWMVGDIKSFADGQFGMYWLEETPFDIQEVAQFVNDLFVFSSAFWQDNTTEPYRVFVRINEESTQTGSTVAGSGGTALLRSFLFGYNAKIGVDAGYLKELIAHEMTHNWTPWLGGTSAEQSRYNEGSAEYWSLRLLWRAGLISSQEYLDAMNLRASDYFKNPTANLTDEAAMEIAWIQREAQRIPYGRGMLHFTNIDAQLRASSDGQRKLDDLAIPFLQTCRAQGGACGSEEWFALLGDALGAQAVDEWKAISNAKPLVLLEGSLGPCFDVVSNTTSAGVRVYQWQAKLGVDISSPECLI